MQNSAIKSNTTKNHFVFSYITKKIYNVTQVLAMSLWALSGPVVAYAEGSQNIANNGKQEEEPGECSVIDLDNSGIQMGEPIVTEEETLKREENDLNVDK